MPSENACECADVKLNPPFRETVRSVLINSHLRDTIPKIDRPSNSHRPAAGISSATGPTGGTGALLNPPQQSLFDSISTAVRESVYKSERDYKLAQPMRSWSKPADVTNMSRTFGRPTSAGPCLYDLILPPDVPATVKDGWRCEDVELRKDFNYKPPFDRCHTFGNYQHANIDGSCVKRSLNWIYHPANVCVISGIQSAERERTTAPDGKSLEPLKNRLRVPHDFAYGLPYVRSSACVANTLTECETSAQKRQIYDSMSLLNRLRLGLKNRTDGVDFNNILQAFRHFDPQNCGHLDKTAVYLLMQKMRIVADYAKLEPLLGFMCILTADGQIRYDAFVELFKSGQEMTFAEKIEDIPADHLHFSTTYGDLLADRRKPFTPNQRPANTQHDCDTTHLINPGPCERHNLHHSDYVKGRTADVMRDLFASSGYRLSDAQFRQCWSECADGHSTNDGGLVSVETFRDYVEKHAIGIE